MTHICISDLTSIGSDNGLSPGRRQAIIRTNAGILLIRPLGTNFSEFLVEILIFSFKKMRLKVSSAKRRLFCLGLNVLTHHSLEIFALVNRYIGSDNKLSPGGCRSSAQTIANILRIVLRQTPAPLLLTWTNFNPNMDK